MKITNNQDAMESILARTVSNKNKKDDSDIFSFRNSVIKPQDLCPAPHLDDWLNYAKRALTEQIYAVLTLPPQHGKTSTIQALLAYLLHHEPNLVHGYLTRELTLAQRKCSEVKDMCINRGMLISQNDKAKADWRLKPAPDGSGGGGLTGRGIGAGINGIGIDGLLIIDDVYKSDDHAGNISNRDKIEKVVVETCTSRVRSKPQGGIVIIGTRWHRDDITGRILRKEILKSLPFVHFDYPALATSENDQLGRKIGERLWPERNPMKYYTNIKESVTQDHWLCTYQGNPQLVGGRVFDGASFFKIQDWKGMPDKFRIGICVDPAATANPKNDYTSVVVALMSGYGKDTEMWIVDAGHAFIRLDQVPEFTKPFVERWPGAKLLVEAGGAFASLPHMVTDYFRDEKVDCDVVAVKPKFDKFTRVQRAAIAWNMGRVMIPNDTEWTREMIAEFEAFTAAGTQRHDGYVDCLGWLFEGMYREKPSGQFPSLKKSIVQYY